jgi:hypothetical protein
MALVNMEVPGRCANCVTLHPPQTFGHLSNMSDYIKLNKNIPEGNLLPSSSLKIKEIVVSVEWNAFEVNFFNKGQNH